MNETSECSLFNVIFALLKICQHDTFVSSSGHHETAFKAHQSFEGDRRPGNISAKQTCTWSHDRYFIRYCSIRAQATRSSLKRLLTRQDVRDRLAACGISPLLAARCLEGLSDVEIEDIASHIENLPSGGSGGPWGLVGIALVVTFLILLTTDLLGYTDVFNIR